MEGVVDTQDPVTGLEVRSLYGSSASSLEPRADDLDGLDAILVDVPDIGCRYYTFAATMDGVMAACERSSVEVVVLDRPNPIGGVHREGGRVHQGFESFVSGLPTPVRHGLTLGEIALLLHRERYPETALTVVRCRGWMRESWLDRTGLPWVPPSPNMPTLETAAVYPGMCLVEATTLSEGRGTTRPFHVVGAPGIDSGVLVERLSRAAGPGIGFRPAAFRPMFGKHAGSVCHGVELHVDDREVLEPLRLGLTVLKVIADHFPEVFAWRREPYEFVSDIPAIDLLTGSDAARHAVAGGRPLAPVLDRWRGEVEEFDDTLEGILLYHE